MIAMAQLNGDYITVARAAELANVSGTIITRELRKHLDDATGQSKGGRVSGYLLHARTWMVLRRDVEAMAKTLGWKAGKPRQAKKTASRRRAKKAV
jgi:hypothetical protein